MKMFNRKPQDKLLVVPYSKLDKVERKYLIDRNHFYGEDHQDVLYCYGRPFAIIGATKDPPYVCEVCHTNSQEVFKCSTCKGIYWGHERCIVGRSKELFDSDNITDCMYFGMLFTEESLGFNSTTLQSMQTFEDVNSRAKPRDFLFVAHLHGASKKQNVDDITLTFRDGSKHFQEVVDEDYYTKKVFTYE